MAGHYGKVMHINIDCLNILLDCFYDNGDDDDKSKYEQASGEQE